MPTDQQQYLAVNLKSLRTARGMSQQRASDLCELPRATWASLESGGANPTLAVLSKVATALQVSIEELIGAPRSAVQFYSAGELPRRKRQGNEVKKLLPEALPGLDLLRMELAPGGQLNGIPHTPGTREYLHCDQGHIALVLGGERYQLQSGDCLVFRGDQRHTYINLDKRAPATTISVICFAPAVE